MTLVYVYGSGECEQLGLGDDQPFEIKKPRKPEIFDTGNGFPARSIIKIVCGGMHTVALTNQGTVYTWGCNDEGALGREGAENAPHQVDSSLPLVTDISAGDSHTIAYNKNTNQLFYWGCYRNAQSGKTFCRQDKPQQLAKNLFNENSKLRIKKIASGSHHTLLLTECGKVYGWGDAESGKIGRMLATRNKNNQALKIEPLGAKNATDIFCGNQHSFYINDKHQLFAWGLNNHGQLGLGNKNNCSVPTRVRDLDPYVVDGKMIDWVVEVAGGEHHSIARTERGVVYAWGRNDEGQVGQGDLYGDYRKKKAQEAQEKQQREEEETTKKAEQAKLADESQVKQVVDGVISQNVQPSTGAAPDDPPVQSKTETPIKKKPVKKRSTQVKAEKEEDLKRIYYFYRPELVDQLWKWDLEDEDDEKVVRKPAQSISAAGQYCYAVCGDEVYSWGMGENYVLGNRQDDNQFEPYKLDPRMFENNKVIMMGLGTQHAVALTQDGTGNMVPELILAQKTASPQQSKPQTPARPPIQTGKVAPKSATPAKQAQPSQHSQPAAQQEQAQPEPQQIQAQVEPEFQAAKEEEPQIDSPVSESKKRSREDFEADQEENAEEQQQPEKRLKVEDEPEAVAVPERSPEKIAEEIKQDVEVQENNQPNDS